MANGVQYLHNIQIVHKDIKPSNVLLCRKDGQVKLSDFGLSKEISDEMGSFSYTPRCTKAWAPPEILNYQLFNPRLYPEVDIFSLGCVFFFVMTSKHPFGDSEAVRIRSIARGDAVNIATNCQIGYLFKHLIYQMLKQEPENRLNSSKVVNHPYFWTSEKVMDVIATVKESTLSANDVEKSNRTMLDDLKEEILGDEDWRDKIDSSMRSGKYSDSVTGIVATY